MAINFYAEQTEMPAFKKTETKEWIKAVAAGYGKKIGDVSYIFCDDAKILEVNKQYLQHDYYTDIITFDYTEGDKIGGDLFISVDTVKSNAEQFEQSFDKELHRVIIHGILHLCGIDDQSPEQRANMIENENKALTLIGM
ncbi:MAG: rRNA maturation RNase YbeY [Bacteroidales bacterium]